MTSGELTAGHERHQAPVARVRVPARSWRSDLRAI
jgi:hypothetical protein